MEYIIETTLHTLVLLLDIKLVTDGFLLSLNPDWSWWQAKLSFYQNHSTKLAFTVALTSMLGSLFYSEIMRYPPCELCWWQRIFMYSSALLLGWSLWQSDQPKGLQYAAVLSVPGALTAAYHVGLHQFKRFMPETACGAGEVSCAASYTFQYGYITIPMMALTGFLTILALYWVEFKTTQ